MRDKDTNIRHAFWCVNTVKLLQLFFGSAIAQITILGINAHNPVIAQTITPATDGTNTIVNQTGNQINITGGTLSGNNTNLFHSFQTFGLDANQIANFLSNPNIQNILGRVVGGDPSVINGLIRVTGGNSNLYLLNPAGIIFGSNSSLNVPSSFTATTANSISIGNDWFHVFGNNNYQNLIGTPTNFKFDANQPGSIINLGNLTVGQDLNLLAGSVISTGTLTANNGNITVASVPGEKLIRISQTGNLLSLEIPAEVAQTVNIDIPTLAQLLTGAGLEQNLTINDQQIALNSGDVVAKSVQANNAILSANNNLVLPESQLITTNNLTLGGEIKLNSQNGTVTTNNLNSNTDLAGKSSNITIQAFGNIITGDLSTATNNDNAGFVNLISKIGRVETGNINTNSGIGNGGAVDIIAGDRILSKVINSSSQTANGGSVNLNSNNNLVVTSINSQGGISGLGGNVNITTKTLQILGSFVDQNDINASISTTGVTGSGSITINHTNDSLVVGNPLINGTSRSLTSEFNNKIEPIKDIIGTYRQGNITINSPFIKSDPVLNNSPSVQPTNISNITSNIDPKKFLQAIYLRNRENANRPRQESRMSQNQLRFLRGASHGNSNLQLARGQRAINRIEEINTQEFTSFLGLSTRTGKTTVDIQTNLRDIQRLTGVKSALIYINFTNENSADSSENIRVVQDSDVLSIGVVTAEGLLNYQIVEGATRKQVMSMVEKFRVEITDLDDPNNKDYLVSSQKLYQVLIAPREAELQKQGINNLMFVMDDGLRSIPIAALYDGKQYLVEKYSLALIPSFSLTNTEYIGLKNPEVLAMGAEIFTPEQQQTELRAVPIELSTITKKIKGQYFLNQDFTLNNLKKQRTIKSYPIIHLATHAYFPSTKNANNQQAYIQLYNDKLPISKIEQLSWNNPPVELLVLSACRSAIGDDKAELGFAGLAVKSGVKSAIASMWYVSDSGTFGLMTEFYNQLRNTPIKAEALRQAQIAMLRRQVRLEGNEFVFSEGKIPIPPELVTYLKNDLSHPYYWAAFNVIGSPW
jgi:filamentous hemagglutinin family protein